MIVECPRCRARYRVESELLERDQTFKCSRCSHVFAYEARPPTTPPEVEPRPAGAAAPATAVEVPPTSRESPSESRDAGSLALPFSDRGEAAEAPETPVERDEPGPATEESQPWGGPPLRSEWTAGRPEELDFAFDAAEERGPEPDADPPPDEPEEDQPRFVRGEEELRIQEREGANPARPYVFFLGMLVAAYAVLTLDFVNHPARAERLLARVPMIGPVLAQDQLLQIRVHLQDVRGAYQRIKEDKRVFIVSGRAVNTSKEPLKGVQIESRLYDPSGHPVETKSIYCGNAMSLKIVKDLSTKEISLLQRLEPPKRFEIRPGESAAFSVVFLSPPTDLKDFTVRVVAAQSNAS